ncbi:MAG: formylglycine-generating enzyme family protein [Pseudomonadota bacterium]
MRLALLPAVFAALLGLQAGAQELDATFKPIAQTFAQRLAAQDTGGPTAPSLVSVYLPRPRSPYGVACEPLAGTLRRALRNALTPELDRANRDNIRLIEDQALDDNELVLALTWARFDDRLEVSAAYGQISGDRLFSTGLRSVSVPLDILPPSTSGCLRPLEHNTGELRQKAEMTIDLRRDIGGAGPRGRVRFLDPGTEFYLIGWLGGSGSEIAVVELLSDDPLEENLGYARLARPETLPKPRPRRGTQVAVGLEPEPKPGASNYPDLSRFRDPLKGGGRGPEMVVIPSGRYVRGAPDDESGAQDDERPQRRVTIRRFALSRTEITFDQWTECVLDGYCQSNPAPSDQGWGAGGHPVINVSYSDIVGERGFLDWINSGVEGSPYRLPSEAEWEYAVRANRNGGGKEPPFHFGNTISIDQANYNDNRTFSSGRTLPVHFRPSAENAWGLRHMHGNVREWVQDCWHGNYQNAPQDGSAWMAEDGGNCKRAVLRGGSWSDFPTSLRSAHRNWSWRINRSSRLGFRLARALPD